MKLEIALAFLQSFSCLAAFLLIVNLVVFILFAIWHTTCFSQEEERASKKRFAFLIKFFPITVLLVFVAAAPTVNEIWKIRIALIKLQLASPENIQKSVDTIEDIGRKLECKYLGCEDKK